MRVHAHHVHRHENLSREKAAQSYPRAVPMCQSHPRSTESSRNLSRGEKLSQLKIITKTQSQSPGDNHLVQHRLSLSFSAFILRRRLPSERSPSVSPSRSSQPSPDAEKVARTRSGSESEFKDDSHGASSYARASALERAKREGAYLCTKALCALSDDPAREASYRSVRSTHFTCLVCVCDDPTGPVFWPRLTRALAACSPRSHPSGHALFHPGERIVRGVVALSRPRPIGRMLLCADDRLWRLADDWRTCLAIDNMPRGRPKGGR